MDQARVRPPACAGRFYPGTSEACARGVAACRARASALPEALRGAALHGGLVPHAGWIYSGATALAVFDALAQAAPRPETVIVFATAHRPGVERPALQTAGTWRAPGGEVALDEELARAMLTETGAPGAPLQDAPRAHDGDHAIEVQLPFLLDALPGARLVPVAMPLTEHGAKIGEAAARAAEKTGRAAVALASTDLTHYGPRYYGFAPKGVGPEAHRWAKEVNDRAFLDKVLALDAGGAYETGRRERSACGASAAAAALAFAKARGAERGVLLEHVTSWERDKESRGEPEDFVGYAGVVFV